MNSTPLKQSGRHSYKQVIRTEHNDAINRFHIKLYLVTSYTWPALELGQNLLNAAAWEVWSHWWGTAAMLMEETGTQCLFDNCLGLRITSHLCSNSPKPHHPNCLPTHPPFSPAACSPQSQSAAHPPSLPCFLFLPCPRHQLLTKPFLVSWIFDHNFSINMAETFHHVKQRSCGIFSHFITSLTFQFPYLVILWAMYPQTSLPHPPILYPSHQNLFSPNPCKEQEFSGIKLGLLLSNKLFRSNIKIQANQN